MQQPKKVAMPILKRIFDIIVSGLAVIILSPILAIIILAIKIEGIFIPKSRGPLFYEEKRLSQGQSFILRKFRIFKIDSYLEKQNNGDTVVTKNLERNDKNLTHTGKILKKFYLDEAPQLFSVLADDMSMVGPRPWIARDVDREAQKGEYRKLVIKAGLTGPVQIHKFDAENHGGEQKLDNDYIVFVRSNNGISVVLKDTWIIIKSFLFMLRGQGL